MKRIVLSVATVVVLLYPRGFAQESKQLVLTNERFSQTVRGLAASLQSGSPGLQASAAETIRELRAVLPSHSYSSLVIPLMGVVKDEHADVSARIVAALALNELESDMGNFAIKRVARFSECKRIRNLCAWLTYNRHQATDLARLGKPDTAAFATRTH